jgi:hypothetical protein
MTTTPLDQRADARYRQEVIAAYRAWLTYLEAQQTILVAQRSGDAVDAFEGASAGQERADAARSALAALPSAQRDLFDAVYAAERQQEQQRQDAATPQERGSVTRVDPDQVAQAALTSLLRDARGQQRTDGRGVVPRGTPDAISWLAIDLAAVESTPPSETDYQLSGPRRTIRRKLIINGVLAALALCLIPVVILLTRPSTPTTTTRRPVSSTGATLAPWAIIALRDAAGTWRVPVSATTTRWPDAADSGFWLDGAIYPLELCLPRARLLDLTELIVEATDGAPVRHYRPSDPAVARPDLRLHACDDRDHPVWLGTLYTVEMPPMLALGDTTPTGLRVEQITVIGVGDDPTLATGRMAVLVTVHALAATDWLAQTPALLLPTGERVLASATDTTEATTTLRYLVPEQAEPMPVAWQISQPDGQIVRYRATLAPPPSRDAVLRAALRIGAMEVAPAQQTMQVTMTVTNAGERPLQLTAADLRWETSGQISAVAAPTLPAPLDPGEAGAVVLDLPLEEGVLHLGPFRYQVTVQS